MIRLLTGIAVMLLAGCGNTDGGGVSSTDAATPEAGQAAGIAKSVNDVEAAMAAAATPLPAASEPVATE